MADSYPRYLCPKQCSASFRGDVNVDGDFRQAEGHATVTAEFDEDGSFSKEIAVEDYEIDNWDDFEYNDSSLEADDADELVCVKCGSQAIDTDDMDDNQVLALLL